MELHVYGIDAKGVQVEKKPEAENFLSYIENEFRNWMHPTTFLKFTICIYLYVSGTEQYL